jgi:hypothetical protein
MKEIVYLNTLKESAEWMRNIAALLRQTGKDVGVIPDMLDMRAARIDAVTNTAVRQLIED